MAGALTTPAPSAATSATTVDGADLRGAISGPPSAYAEASLEAEADRIRAPAERQLSQLSSIIT